MKKSLGLFAAIGTFAFATPAVAQMGARSLEFGIKGGATFATADVEEPDGADIGYLTSIPSGGVFLRIPLGSLALQPELLFMRKGASVTDEDFGSDVSLDVKLDYIEIPLLLVVPIGTGERAAPYLFGGGAVAFEAGCKFSADGGNVSIDVDCDEGDEEDLELQRKKVDYGAVFGAGIRIPAGSGAFLIEGRYTLGLADIDDSGDSDSGFKNRAAAAFIGYSFTIGR